MLKRKIYIVILFFTLVWSSFSVFLSRPVSASTSFLMNPKKIYVYNVYDEKNKNNKTKITASFVERSKEGDLWHFKENHLLSHKLFLQDKEGLRESDPFYAGLWQQMIKFPLREGKEWAVNDDERKFKLVSLKTTVKTPVGTFSNCIKVTSRAGAVYYYAPGTGIVKQRTHLGKIIELTKVKDTHYGRVLIKQDGIKLYDPKGKVHRSLKKGEGLKVFKETADLFDVGGGYYVKKSKGTLFYTGFIYSILEGINMYSPNGKLNKKIADGKTLRVYSFKDGKYQVGGGYYVPMGPYIQYDR